MATTTTMSGAAFDQLPYDESRRLELLGGEVIEVGRATARHQRILTLILISVLSYLQREGKGGALPDLEFALGEDDRLCPDLGILLGEHWTSLDENTTPIAIPPDIAVEVISPSERTADSMRKVSVYLRAGVQEVWQVYPDTQEVYVHHRNHADTLHIDDSLARPLLPGWQMPIREIFSPR